ncbi:MAG: hypothetical protein R3C68_12390 [Myxococcota bacterium]
MGSHILVCGADCQFANGGGFQEIPDEKARSFEVSGNRLLPEGVYTALVADILKSKRKVQGGRADPQKGKNVSSESRIYAGTGQG